VAAPQNLLGLTDQLDGPAFSTSVGLLHWARRESLSPIRARKKKAGTKPPINVDLNRGLDFLKRLLP
jgi:cell division protein FtsA